MNTADESPSIKHSIIKWLAIILGTFISLSIVIVLSLRWINPPTSSFMLQREYQAWWNNEPHFELQQQWIDWDKMDWQIKVAAVTSEDQRFAEHWGIDIKQVKKALKESKNGDDLRGASTITQQTAKNLFLWPAHSFVRKGIEAYFALLMELFWPKKRILEVYLNIAQFGNEVFGVQTAARCYFHTTAGQLSKAQAALMVVALPNPDRYNLAHPSPYMLRRQKWNMRYMNYLGNRAYLRRLK